MPLATGRLGVVSTVRTSVHKPNLATAASLDRIDAPHIRLIVLSMRVICSVHRYGCGVVVYANGHLPVQTHFQAGRGATTSSKQVDNDPAVRVVEREAVLG